MCRVLVVRLSRKRDSHSLPIFTQGLATAFAKVQSNGIIWARSAATVLDGWNGLNMNVDHTQQPDMHMHMEWGKPKQIAFTYAFEVKF